MSCLDPGNQFSCPSRVGLALPGPIPSLQAPKVLRSSSTNSPNQESTVIPNPFPRRRQHSTPQCLCSTGW